MGPCVEKEGDRGLDIMRYKWKERKGTLGVAEKGKYHCTLEKRGKKDWK